MKTEGANEVRRWFRAWTVAILAGVFASSVPLYAQGAKVSSPAELARIADALQPGEWVWAPEVAPTGPILIYVDLSRQLATVYRNGIRIAVSTISSGKEGHETPTGVFTILQKDADHHSNIYNNAPMYYQERLTWGGVALHAGGLPGYPESHGCIHLPSEFAKDLFDVSPPGMTVVIADTASEPTWVTHPGYLAPISVVGGKAVNEDPLQSSYQDRWQPEASLSGPVSIVLSRQSQ